MIFQGQSVRSKHWFDIDIKWFEENFSTIEPQFYKKLFQGSIEGQDGSKYTTLPVTIVNTKETGEILYYPKAPLVEYHQNDYHLYSLRQEKIILQGILK